MVVMGGCCKCNFPPFLITDCLPWSQLSSILPSDSRACLCHLDLSGRSISSAGNLHVCISLGPFARHSVRTVKEDGMSAPRLVFTFDSRAYPSPAWNGILRYFSKLWIWDAAILRPVYGCVIHSLIQTGPFPFPYYTGCFIINLRLYDTIQLKSICFYNVYSVTFSVNFQNSFFHLQQFLHSQLSKEEESLFEWTLLRFLPCFSLCAKVVWGVAVLSL